MSRNKQNENAQESKPEKTRRQKLEDVLKTMEDNLKAPGAKVSVSDFMRLIEFERQLADAERPREMKVTWSEPLEMYDIDE